MAKKNKLKIRKSILRRFKVTKTGKVLRASSFSRHLRRKKQKSQIRKYRKPKLMTGKYAKKVRLLLAR